MKEISHVLMLQTKPLGAIYHSTAGEDQNYPACSWDELLNNLELEALTPLNKFCFLILW